MFGGTRVAIQTLFGYLEGGETLGDFLEGFPTVSRESSVAALEEAKHLLLARAQMHVRHDSHGLSTCTGTRVKSLTFRETTVRL